MKRIVIALAVAAVVVLVGVSLRGGAIPVEVTRAEARTVRQFIAEDAKTRLDDEYIVAMPVSGTLERIALEIGDQVDETQPVAQVDTFAIQQQIKSVEATIEKVRTQITGVDVSKPKSEDLDTSDVAVRQMRDNLNIAAKQRRIVEIDLAEAKRNFERIEELYRQGAVSQARFDEAERVFKGLTENLERVTLAESSARKALQAAELASERIHGSVDDNEYMREAYLREIENLEAQLDILKDDLTKSTIRAPVASLVLEKYVEDRRVLMAGTPLMKLGDLNSIEIESDVLSEEVGGIRNGQAVEITGKALAGETIMGVVKRVYPSGFMKISALGVEQQRVRVIIAFDNSRLALRPGTSVDVRIITSQHEGVIAVPERATFRHGGGWAVFVVQGRKARLTPIELGLKNDEWAEVASGLEAGAVIVAEPKNELRDGTRIIAMEE